MQVDLAHPLEHADEEGVDSDQRAGVRRLDVALAELRAEALQQAQLLIGEVQAALGGCLLQAQQAVVLGQQPVTLPNPADTGRGDLDALQVQLVGHPNRSMAGLGQRMVEDGLLDRLGQPIGMWATRAGQPIEQAGGAVGLEVAADR